MKLKIIIQNFPVLSIAAVVAFVFVAITAFFKPILAIIEFALFILFAAHIITSVEKYIKKKNKALVQISSAVNFSGGDVSEKIPLPVVVCNSKGEIKWFNDIFEKVVLSTHSQGYEELSDMFKEMGVDSILASSETGLSVDFDNQSFRVFSHKTIIDGEDTIVMYLIENTRYRRIADEYFKTRPYYIIMTIDNISEIQQDFKETDCNAIRNGIEKLIEKWSHDYGCLVTEVSYSKFIIFTEKQTIDKMVENRFDILDVVREYTYDRKYVGATLSMGIGTGKNSYECESNAKLALDMALGRGGDQAVIKVKDKYDFFGGISKSVEQVNSVKTRVVATAFSELISGCENVVVMGHRFPDFDAIGAAYGVLNIAVNHGKKAYIVTDKEKTMAGMLLNYADSENLLNAVISKDKALSVLNDSKKTLLVVVDTHIKNFVEFPELLEKSNMTVVIDHHRKSVDYIENTVIFYHDPSASSTSEMVTQLIKYMPEITKIGSFTADALLSGIMLDTKNFILRVNSKTFESAAYLKEQGADTVRVKKLFSNDIDSYHLRNKIVGSAHKYKNCAIAVADEKCDDIRIISAQAADELLTISGVDASFVIFEYNDMICISARSFGAVNVQVVMENMNGGGHQTMAAAQIKNSTIKEVTEQVMLNIDKYNDTLKNKERN